MVDAPLWRVEVTLTLEGGTKIAYHHSIPDLELHRLYEAPDQLIASIAEEAYEQIQKKRLGIGGTQASAG